ncbi:MAG: hypothetical protein EOP06_12195 [Proteobacteria bacterium]|nr:MAG: hypothetical protein EOP06_12195 [Pseudomonadota bacterium]
MMTVFINRKSVQKVLPKIFFCALMCVISIGVAKNIGQIANFSAQAAKAPKVGYKPANAFDMLFPEVIRDQFRAIQIARTAFSLNTLGDPAYYKNNAYTDLVLDTPSNYLRSTPKLTFIALFEPANYILSKKANLSLYDALTSIEGLVGACFVLFAIFASIRSSSPSLILIVIISVILLLIATSVSVNMVTYRRMKMGYFTSLSSMGFALAWSQLTVSGWKAYFADRKKAV